MSEEETEEENEFDKFVTTSLRGPKRGIYQQLLALLLVKANRTNDPLIKIASISEAALMSRKKDKLDMNLVHVCYNVSTSLRNSEVQQRSQSWLHYQHMIDLVNVSWIFPTSEETFKKYIEPWQHTPLSFYPYHTHWRRKNIPFKDRIRSYWHTEHVQYYNEAAARIEEICDKVVKEIDSLSPDQRFFEKTSALTKQSFEVLKGEFTDWALKRLLETQAIISEEVDPEVYKETLVATIRAEREDAE